MVMTIGISQAVAADPPTPTTPEELVSKEYQVKAAFLFNFLKFVEWPDSAFADADAPITIGMLGAEPFGSMLDRIIAGERIQGRRIAIRRADTTEALTGCHLVFLSKFEARRTAELLSAFGSEPVLTVSGVDDFCAAGGIIQFTIEAGKVRFLVNATRAQAIGLKISSQLLSVGKQFPPAKSENRR
ncbi:MAG: YfiR family protein [Planctomycetes bacterium]|nr:YfiR family protein [Planctomycetota bacterium]